MSSNVSNDELNYAEPENSENNTDSGVTVTIDVNKGALDSNAWDKVKANVVELETAAKEGNLDISGTQIKIKSLKDICAQVEHDEGVRPRAPWAPKASS